MIISIGFNTTLYGHSYHLIVERDRTHLRTKFVFDEKHDIKFCKPVERMGKQQISEGEVQKLLAKEILRDTTLAASYTALEMIHDKYGRIIGNDAIQLRQRLEQMLKQDIKRKVLNWDDVWSTL